MSVDGQADDMQMYMVSSEVLGGVEQSDRQNNTRQTSNRRVEDFIAVIGMKRLCRSLQRRMGLVGKPPKHTDSALEGRLPLCLGEDIPDGVLAQVSNTSLGPVSEMPAEPVTQNGRGLMQEPVVGKPAEDFDETVLVAVEDQLAANGTPLEQFRQSGTVGWIEKDLQAA